MAEVEFVDGIKADWPKKGAPEFIVANISVNVEKLIEYLSNCPYKYLDLQLNESRKKTPYICVNNYKSENKKLRDGFSNGKSQQQQQQQTSNQSQGETKPDFDFPLDTDDDDSCPF